MTILNEKVKSVMNRFGKKKQTLITVLEKMGLLLNDRKT